MAGAPPQIPLGELTALPQTPSWIQGGLLLRAGEGEEGKERGPTSKGREEREGKGPTSKGREVSAGGGRGGSDLDPPGDPNPVTPLGGAGEGVNQAG